MDIEEGADPNVRDAAVGPGRGGGGAPDLACHDSLSGRQSNWKFFGSRIPKSEIVFATQTLMLYIVIIVCLVNLTISTDDNSNLWTALLSSSLGLMLPSPTMKRDKSAINNMSF